MVISALFQQFNQWSPTQGTTRRKCRFALKKLMCFYGDIEAVELTSAIASRFQVYMKNAGMSDGSVGSYFAAASQVFAWAVEQGLLKANPFASAKKIKPGKMEIHCYKPEQIEALLQAVNSISWRDPVSPLRWTAFFWCSLSGLRLGEILNLRWDDLDLDEGVVRIQYRPDKKGEYWQWGSKGKSDRIVPMGQALWNCLCRLKIVAPWRYPFLKQQRCFKLQSRIGQIPEHIRKSPYTNFYRELIRIKSAAKIKSGGVHMLRRNAATHLAEQNLPLHEAKVLLGHQSIQTTLHHYIVADRKRCLDHGRVAFDAYEWAR